MTPRGFTLLAAGVLAAAGAAALVVGYAFREAPPGDDEAAVVRAFERIRNAIVEGDDRNFFEMHSREARDRALENFPFVRSWFVSATPEEREEFLRKYALTEKEFLEGDPREMVMRLMPEKSGWRERREMFRVARVHSVRFLPEAAGEEGAPPRAAVLLNIDEAVELQPGQRIPEKYLPTVVFVKDPDGWRRHSFFFGE